MNHWPANSRAQPMIESPYLSKVNCPISYSPVSLWFDWDPGMLLKQKFSFYINVWHAKIFRKITAQMGKSRYPKPNNCPANSRTYAFSKSPISLNYPQLFKQFMKVVVLCVYMYISVTACTLGPAWFFLSVTDGIYFFLAWRWTTTSDPMFYACYMNKARPKT